MTRLTFLSKLILFLTSYIPLGIICLIIDFNNSEFPYFNYKYYSFSLLIIMVLLVILLLFLGHHFNNRPTGWEKMKVESSENMNSQILSYIFSYILPFLSFPEERRIIISIFLLFIIGILYVKSDMLGINPLLSVLGYHIMKIKMKKRDSDLTQEVTVISKLDYFRVKRSRIVNVFQIHNELYLLKGE